MDTKSDSVGLGDEASAVRIRWELLTASLDCVNARLEAMSDDIYILECRAFDQQKLKSPIALNGVRQLIDACKREHSELEIMKLTLDEDARRLKPAVDKENERRVRQMESQEATNVLEAANHAHMKLAKALSLEAQRLRRSAADCDRAAKCNCTAKCTCSTACDHVAECGRCGVHLFRCS
jgi:hypothetical protein